MADIHTLCSFMCFNWQEILAEARQKEAGVEAPLAAEILTGMPNDDFNAVKWIERPDWAQFHSEIAIIAEQLLKGDDNHLARLGTAKLEFPLSR